MQMKPAGGAAEVDDDATFMQIHDALVPWADSSPEGARTPCVDSVQDIEMDERGGRTKIDHGDL